TNVSVREGDLCAGGLELGRHALAALAVPIAECHARALGNETPDRRLADPRCPARHRCNLAVEPSHVRHLSLHCETRIHDTSYPSGGHRLVGLARPGYPTLTGCGSFRRPLSGPFDGLTRFDLHRTSPFRGEGGKVWNRRISLKKSAANSAPVQ